MALSAVGEQYLPARLRPFIFLSHPAERPSHLGSQSSILWSRYYRIGPDDLPLIIGWTVIVLVLRWIILRQLKKFAHYWLGQSDRSDSPLSDVPNVNESVIPNTNSATSLATTNGHAISNGNGLTSRKSLNGDVASKVGKDGDVQSPHRKRARALKAALKAREHTATRFAEQGFSCIYYILAWCYGLVSIRCSSLFVGSSPTLSFRHLFLIVDSHRYL
jgi:very-long-chain ceramide synthase